jgi:hypothetical protein
MRQGPLMIAWLTALFTDDSEVRGPHHFGGRFADLPAPSADDGNTIQPKSRRLLRYVSYVPSMRAQNVHPADADILELTLAQAHQLIAGLAVLPPTSQPPPQVSKRGAEGRIESGLCACGSHHAQFCELNVGIAL